MYWSTPAEEGEDDVGGHTQDGGQRDRDADRSGPERAVVAVVVELELAADHRDQGEDAPGGDAVPDQSSEYFARKFNK